MFRVGRARSWSARFDPALRSRRSQRRRGGAFTMTPPVDPLLREALLGRTPEDGSMHCLDADTLAAWFEGTLSADDRRATEAHVADCARCQMLMAAMARTAPPEVTRP